MYRKLHLCAPHQLLLPVLVTPTRLSLVTEMTKHIRVRASGGDDDTELASFTPAFLWLLRDFYLRLEEEGRKVSWRVAESFG